jgi:phosphoribosylglycinamide formyltransferase-1
MQRLVVLISGNGSNLQAIIDACQQQEINAEIVTIISNKSDAYGLQRAQQANIKTIVQEKISGQTRQEYDQELAQLINDLKPNWIVLAGWMRLLSNKFLQCFPGKVINLHPALPGMFPGVNAIERALIAFQNGEITQTGIMVHQVPDEGVDSGPVVAQQIVPIYNDDTLNTLSKRMHTAEHQLLISTLKNLTSEN